MYVMTTSQISLSAVDLTQALVRLDSTNPPGHEQACADLLAPLLKSLGWQVQLIDMEQGRPSLVALYKGQLPETLMLSGHLDTVPLGADSWSRAPFGGEIVENRIYGRGTSDMKAGIAAMVVAAARLASQPFRKGLAFVLSAGEETGCCGARSLVATAGQLPSNVDGLLIGEPTSNRVGLAHKGALLFEAHATGKTVHSSMPWMGDNAIYKAAEAIRRIADHEYNRSSAAGNHPTINVGMISGGLNANSVPDSARFSIDIRMPAGANHEAIEHSLGQYLGDQIALRRTLHMPAVMTCADEPFSRCVFDAVEEVTKRRPDDSGVFTYFTDGSVFQPHLNVPTLLCGPGNPAVAHQIDEYCDITCLLDSCDIYEQVIKRWCL